MASPAHPLFLTPFTYGCRLLCVPRAPLLALAALESCLLHDIRRPARPLGRVPSQIRAYPSSGAGIVYPTVQVWQTCRHPPDPSNSFPREDLLSAAACCYHMIYRPRAATTSILLGLRATSTFRLPPGLWPHRSALLFVSPTSSPQGQGLWYAVAYICVYLKRLTSPWSEYMLCIRVHQALSSRAET